MNDTGEITLLLQQSRQGDSAAGERLYTLLYAELRRLARAQLHRAGQHTLDPSALIHDAWLRCQGATPSDNRRQFFAYASTVMRSVIVDHVRERVAAKRGGGHGELTLSTGALEAIPAAAADAGIDAQAIEDALQALGRIDERALKVVEMRYFGGMTLEEIADATTLSVPTLKRDWQRARAFLYERLQQP